MMNREIYDRVSEEIRSRAVPPDGSVEIGPDTEIYKDLGIYGDDLFELLIWVQDEFGVDVTMDGTFYAPPESQLLNILTLRAFKKRTKTGKDYYKSFTIRDLVQAIEAGGRRFE